MRLPATWDVWVYWECGPHADVSHVRDLSLGGLFIETHRRRPNGDVIQMHFLVPEGQIRLDGTVMRFQPSEGLGLKFQSVTNEDVPQLSALLSRIRSAPPTTPASCRLINFCA
jgi:hypothetical protein